MARERKRRLHYVSNILVINDPENPQNNGQVKLYQFGKRIFDKIMDAMQPQYADESPVNPYDFWEGADFKIKIRKVDGWVNYDKSEFSAPAALYDGDESQLQDVYGKLYSLGEFTDPKQYKSYDELKAKLNRVLGVDAGISADMAAMSTAPVPTMETTSNFNVGTSAPEPSLPASEESSSDEDDTLSYFNKLANES